MDKLERARMMLRVVIDPELGVNIVDLGLIYDMRVVNNKLYLKMTFTAVGCPMSGSLIDQVYAALAPLGFDDIKVEVTFDPPWTPDRMTDEGRRMLGIL